MWRLGLGTRELPAGLVLQCLGASDVLGGMQHRPQPLGRVGALCHTILLVLVIEESVFNSGSHLGRPDLLPRTLPVDEANSDSIATTLSTSSLGSGGLNSPANRSGSCGSGPCKADPSHGRTLCCSVDVPGELACSQKYPWESCLCCGASSVLSVQARARGKHCVSVTGDVILHCLSCVRVPVAFSSLCVLYLMALFRSRGNCANSSELVKVSLLRWP